MKNTQRQPYMQEEGMLRDEDILKKSQIFSPKVALKILGFNGSNYRDIRTKIDPEGDKRKDGFSHNILFVYFIFYTLRERKLFSVRDILEFKWKHIFQACEIFDLEDIREMGIIYCPSNKKVWLVPKSTYEKYMRNDRFDGLKMEYVYLAYASRLALEFKPKLKRNLTHEEQTYFLMTQPQIKEVLLRDSEKPAKLIPHEDFDHYFNAYLKSQNVD